MSEQRMIDLIESLFPICRSITGDGIRQSLALLQDIIPLEIVEVPSGTSVLDWQVPKEWNVKDAYIKDASGNRLVDFRKNNLHVLNYSAPMDRTMPLSELRPHLFSLPDQPDLIPYRTSYYDENWGFCLSHRQLETLPDGNYQVVIDSSLEDGSLSYGECFLPGQSQQEVLISTHICHPSLCNDNLSGIAVATFLADSLVARDCRYSYRFLFVPVTIGAIAWLAQNEDKLSNIRHGLVASNLADKGGFTYKKSRSGRSTIDRVVERVLRNSGVEYELREFIPYGYDERQYGSPGFDLPVGSLSRTPYGEYPEYHTSADNLDFISHKNLSQSLDIYKKIGDELEHSRFFRNLQPKGEPQLGRRGLYKKVGGETDQKETQMAILWLLNQSDGNTSLLEVAELSSIDLSKLSEVAEILVVQGLLKEISDT
ncbi:MAG: peptidase M28 [Gammaproteobacteria bacterium]|nr:MAG: peptidase M28 [Gammaproteobacteria bacterium]